MALLQSNHSNQTNRAHGGLYGVKPRFQALLAPLAHGLAARNVHPDTLTFAAVGCALLGGAALAVSPEQPVLLVAVPLMVVARLSLNALDGMVATRLNVARPWGKVLNELCDRFSDLTFLWPLALVPGANIPLVTAALCATLLVSFIGVLSEAVGGPREYAGVMGKADRMAWLGIAAVGSLATHSFLALQLLPVVLLVGAALTLVQRGARIHAAV
jgi:CDP-diacylglycerol--glycerol-3-phosphate 3-phosphatidyltransferase